MLPTLWDLGSLLAILSIILLSSSLTLTSMRTSVVSKRRLELAAKIVGLAFLVVALYLIGESLV